MRPLAEGVPGPVPPLEEGAVHVWVTTLAPDDRATGADAHEAPATEPWLSDEERARAAQAAPARRREFTAGRRLLRAVCGAHLGCAPAAVPLRLLPSGKPVIDAPGSAALELSLAHAGDVILLAVSRAGAVGVDVERLDRPRNFEAIAARYFAPEEQAALAALPPDARAAAFTRAWTRKEAMVKAIGSGIAGGLGAFAVPVHETEVCGLLRAPAAWAASGPWVLRTLPVPGGYGAALALRGENTPVAVLRAGP
jgi:4'-phosphopantetheinyl transferase